MAALQVILGVTYPLLIFMSLSVLSPRAVAFVVLGVAGLRLLIARRSVAVALAKEVWLPIAAVAFVAVLSAVWNDRMGLLLTPTLINAALLATFGFSLRGSRPIVERFARLQVADLTPAEIRYCRSVTWLWCGFFVVNGLIALFLALAGDVRVWALFTGLISYILIGTLFAAEYLYRHWRFRRFVGGFADPLLKLFFPPGEPPTLPDVADRNDRESQR
jgi:uncharacterized membrane protein